MRGRHASTRSPQDLTRLFRATDWPPDERLAPIWNVAPTDDVYAILERAGREGGDEVRRELRPLRWDGREQRPQHGPHLLDEVA
ncbi:SOS response-associated peptidase family protein [Streptomyces sp900116325]|uniref:SOS response-associated peptidase family protein n=1 Tax=Streptomyces sp. 900116325 TaxID=3154295 RepID=UPI003329FBCD